AYRIAGPSSYNTDRDSVAPDDIGCNRSSGFRRIATILGRHPDNPGSSASRTHDPSLARRNPWSTFTFGIQRPRRDPDGIERQVRAGQADGALEARPGALFRGVLPRELRIHPPDVRRGRRSARRAGPLPGAVVSLDAGLGPRDR